MTVSLEERKSIIKDFLRKANIYAEERIQGYQEQLKSAKAEERLELQAKIMHWTVYLTFNEYPLEHLDTGEMDAWLESKD